MFLETMERVLADTDKVIVDEKAGSGVVPYLPLSEFNKKAPAQAPAEDSQQ
jgi:membrane protease subunit HflK